MPETRPSILADLLATRGGDRGRSGVPSGAARAAQVARQLERVAWLMDRAVGIPGTRFRIGLDAILGLLPIGGDVLTGLVQAGLVLVALYHYRVPKRVAARMAANVLIDIGVGAVPLLGDLFDIAFKANTRNLRLLEPYREAAEGRVIDVTPAIHAPAPPVRSGTPARYLVAIGMGLAVALGLVLLGFVALVRWLATGIGPLG